MFKSTLYSSYLKTINNLVFTQREIDVIACLVMGKSDARIASLLAISTRTVNSHVSNIIQKFGVSSREHVREFVENSASFRHIVEYFQLLKLQQTFENGLVSLKRQRPKQPETQHNIHIKNLSPSTEPNLTLLKKYLAKLAIIIVDDNQSSLAINLANLSDPATFYVAIAKLISKLLPEVDIHPLIAEIEKQLANFPSYAKLQSVRSSSISIRPPLKFKYILFAFVTLICGSLGFLFIKHIQHTHVENHDLTFSSWNLPQPLNHYVQRKALTKQIWHTLNTSNKDSIQFVSLYGLGGAGKTSLANNAINAPKQKYTFRAWFNAESKEMLEKEFLNLGDLLEIYPADLASELKIEKIKAKLSTFSKMLLVFDNVEEINDIETYLPTHAHVIVTSRNHNVPNEIEVSSMTPKESLQLLEYLVPKKTKAPQATQHQIIALSEKLGYLPLALAQAGAYIAETNITPAKYLELFKTERHALLSNDALPTMVSHQPTFVTWDLSLEKILQQVDVQELESLLALIANCYPENIPKVLLSYHLFESDNNSATLKLNTLLSLLQRYSLITLQQDSISVHRLVHSWIKARLSTQQTLNSLIESIKITKKVYLGKIKDSSNFQLANLFVPHYLAMLKQAKQFDLKQETITLLNLLGSINFEYFRKASSIDYYLQSITLQQNNDKNSNPELYLNTILDLAYSYIWCSKIWEAKTILEDSLPLFYGTLGKSHVKTGHAYHALGIAHRGLKQFKSAREYLNKALEIKSQHYDPNHVEIAELLHSLGKFYLNSGEFLLAEQHLQKAQAIFKFNYPENHLKRHYTTQFLAQLYIRLAKFEEAKKLLNQDIEVINKYYNGMPYHIFYRLGLLGEIEINLGNYREALKIFDKAKTIFSQDNMENEISTFQFLHFKTNIVKTYLLLEDFAAAQNDLPDILSYLEKLFDEDNPYYFYHQTKQGYYLLGTDKTVQAIEVFNTILEKTKRLFGDSHIFVAEALSNSANAQRLVKNYLTSENMLLTALGILQQDYAYDHLTRAKVHANLALLYSDLNDKSNADKHKTAALSLFSTLLPDKHPFIAKLKAKQLKSIIGFPIWIGSS